MSRCVLALLRAHIGRWTNASPHRRSASRLTGLFAPGQALLRRFTLVRTFAFVSLLAVLPTLWLGYGYVSGVRADVRFAERELDGVAVVIAENERAGRDRAAANTAALLIETSAAVERFGDARVLQAWSDWRDPYVTGTAPIVDHLHRLEEILITNGDRSNLILDPELDVLRELGCDLAQGFLLGRPVPATRLTELVREQSLV
jgi:hypothetical protein